MGPALNELKKRLRDYRIMADACQIATLFMDIVKDKHGDEFGDWMSQLAADVLREKFQAMELAFHSISGEHVTIER